MTAVRGTSITALRDANVRRTEAAGRGNREIAEQALASWRPGWPETWRQVARAVIDHPGQPWADIAPTIGMNRNQATSHFRRMRIAVTGQ